MIPRMRRRAWFVFVSDCFGDLDELAVSLRVARARGHDVIVMHVLAPEEIHFDFDAGLRFSHWRWMASSQSRSGRVRDAYLRKMKAFLDRLEDLVTDSAVITYAW